MNLSEEEEQRQAESNAEARRESLRAVKAFKELTETKGWKILAEFMTEEYKKRADHIILTPRGDPKSEWDNEFKKGEAAAYRLILEFPDRMIKTESDIAEGLKQDES